MKKLTILALALTICTAGAAFADKPQKGDKGKRDRDATRAYFSQKYGRGNCPPGLAKKNNGCLPPGQAKKRYQIGQRLSRDVVYVNAPADLVARLSPPPRGHNYVMVDGDLVKLALGTLLVVDAIDALH